LRFPIPCRRVKAEDLKTSLSEIRVLSGAGRRGVFYVAKR
jgi:hypothetical protein